MSSICINCDHVRINPETLESYGAGDIYGYCSNNNTKLFNTYSSLSNMSECNFYKKSVCLMIPGISYKFEMPINKEVQE
jgi:hypothetical protein